MREYIGGTNKEDDFNTYMSWGGMPQIYNLQFEAERKTYLADLFNSIIVKDIVERTGLNDVNLLNRLLQFVIENIGGVFSANSVKDYLKSESISLGSDKIYNYLDAVESSLLVASVPRYDIRGKKVLQFYEKFFLVDLGLAQLKRSDYEFNAAGRLENIVYNELIARGKEVYIGENNGREIDFLIKDFDGTSYIQVASSLVDENVLKREIGAFDSVKDNYPKWILSLDKIDYSQNGILHKNVIDWLLDI
jgi:predicted AAA+ superfamily ATPase